MLRPIPILFIVLALAINVSSAENPKTMTYTNPVYNSDFPDPFVLRVNQTYYAYATNGGGNDIQLAQSIDLVNWVYLGNAMGPLPAWVSAGWTWAPEVAAIPSGYAMYYTARHSESGRQEWPRVNAALTGWLAPSNCAAEDGAQLQTLESFRSA